MFRALTSPLHVQSGSIDRRWGLGLVLVVGIAGAATAALFMNAQTDHRMPSSAAGMESLSTESFSAVREPVSTASVAAPDRAPKRDGAEPPHQSGPRTGASAVSGPVEDASSAAGAADLPLEVAHGEGAMDSAVAVDDAAPGATSEQAPMDRVLHITNRGDQIILSYDQHDAYTAVEQPGGLSGGQPASQSGGGEPPSAIDDPGEEDTAGAEQQPDYAEVYPGCPRALPSGSDKQMALEMRANYGCVYLSSCTSRNDEVTVGSCTWYLTGKVSG